MPEMDPSPVPPITSEALLISRLKGTLLSRDLTTVEVETPAGVIYEVEVPLTIQERLPPVGHPVELRTQQVVREDSITLYGFLEPHERDLFRRLLNANGVGAKMAVAMLSTFSARRLARALADKDLAALSQVQGVGRKKAEKFALELADRVQDLALGPEGAPLASPAVAEAVSALVALGFSVTAADAAVRKAFKGGGEMSTEELIRQVLSGT